jgi:hypothetical protein
MFCQTHTIASSMFFCFSELELCVNVSSINPGYAKSNFMLGIISSCMFEHIHVLFW